MTMSTATTKRPAPKATKPGEVFVGQTLRKIRLAAGERPFAVVSVDTATDRASGWLFVNPQEDGNDPLLKELGVQADARLKPCYITVSTNLIR